MGCLKLTYYNGEGELEKTPGKFRGSYTKKGSKGEVCINLYSFGMLQPGRSYNPTQTAYGFNGKRSDDEIYGTKNAYNFGARIYDPRLGRPPTLDAKASKYPGDSPYMYAGNSPIWMIDLDGLEKVVVVGNQGGSPSSDEGYGDNRRHFLQAGLNEAIRLNKQSNEFTTMLIYRGDYSQEELDTYIELADAEGIEVKVVENVDQISDYVNEKNGTDDSRSDDLITSFTYIGHGGRDALYAGNFSGTGKRDITVEDLEGGLFSKDAFHKSSSIILNSCLSCNTRYGTSIGDAFSELAGKEVIGTQNYVNWGQNGLGSFTFNPGTYLTNPFGGGVKTISGKGGVDGPVKQDPAQQIGPRREDGSF